MFCNKSDRFSLLIPVFLALPLGLSAQISAYLGSANTYNGASSFIEYISDDSLKLAVNWSSATILPADRDSVRLSFLHEADILPAKFNIPRRSLNDSLPLVLQSNYADLKISVNDKYGWYDLWFEGHRRFAAYENLDARGSDVFLLTSNFIHPDCKNSTVQTRFANASYFSVSDSLTYQAGFIDPDDDSLHFEFSAPFSGPGNSLESDYFLPIGIEIDAASGLISWDNPEAGIWLLVVRVKEYRGQRLLATSDHSFTLFIDSAAAESNITNLNQQDNYLLTSGSVGSWEIPLISKESIDWEINSNLFSSALDFSTDVSGDTQTLKLFWTPDMSTARAHPHLVHVRAIRFDPEIEENVFRDFSLKITVPGPPKEACTDSLFQIIPEQFSDMLLYPNPANPFWVVELPSEEEASFELFNIASQLIRNSVLIGGQGIFYRDEEAPGVYLIQIEQNGNVFSKLLLLK